MKATKQRAVPKLPDVWRPGHVQPQRTSWTPPKDLSSSAPIKEQRSCFDLVCKLPGDILLTPPARRIGMSGTLEDFCTAGYVQHEVIMHTCNIFYFHMRFKCFLYSLASFSSLHEMQEREEKMFFIKIFAFGTPVVEPVGKCSVSWFNSKDLCQVFKNYF